MKGVGKYKTELAAIFKDQISERELQDFSEGLQSIRQIILERPYLKGSVDFEAVKETLLGDYRKWIRGEKECFLGNRIIKAPRILPRVGTVYGSIPMVLDELSKGIVRPEFRIKRTKGKFIPWKSFVREDGRTERRLRDILDNLVQEDRIKKGMIEYGRKRGQGREIISISQEAKKLLQSKTRA